MCLRREYREPSEAFPYIGHPVGRIGLSSPKALIGSVGISSDHEKRPSAACDGYSVSPISNNHTVGRVRAHPMKPCPTSQYQQMPLSQVGLKRNILFACAESRDNVTWKDLKQSFSPCCFANSAASVSSSAIHTIGIGRPGHSDARASVSFAVRSVLRIRRHSVQ
jgi:hypothetical protein